MTAIKDRWESKDGSIVLLRGDCLEILPGLPKVDAIVVDPPYLTGDSRVPVRGAGVARRVEDTNSVGMPWGYSLDWIDACRELSPKQWVVYANYKMMAGLCSTLDPQTIFVWRKSNAPRMTRPVPRLDCEFIVWHRSGGDCGRMGEFESMVLDVPMPQAGCFATERILQAGSGKALHPCQKPLAIVQPFVDRLSADLILDPYAGTATTLHACINVGKRGIGIEQDEAIYWAAVERLEIAWDTKPVLFTDPTPAPIQRSLLESME